MDTDAMTTGGGGRKAAPKGGKHDSGALAVLAVWDARLRRNGCSIALESLRSIRR